MATPIPIILSHWQHTFLDLQFSSMDFYQQVEGNIVNTQIPDASYKRTALSQTGIFSAKREYLRITRKEYSFDICAAPYGKGFYISYWFGERVGTLKELISRIPVLGPFIINLSKIKTYYQLDTEGMFRSIIHECIMKAIEDITIQKGIRGLSDFERQPEKKSKK